ncbi:ribokinase [Protaetiibacter mangrovi]|uniref:Ribokinase n=1 Tax=Protaetiibacter mangrovi TaxID=2970926 RepID=A0ABT1ZG35_9MICO|nr:ribokinase [Protaetiibacter mangrovi]MCS0499673.1 ribokinase [Protaetiibacter mangrovi]TPW91878.1 ribokinase [Schumannella luteola]
MSSIVVLGSANMDLVVRQPRLPEPGETMFGSSFATVPGGKGLNQAIAAARVGGDVAFLGAVGGDAFGRELRETLTAAGVDTTGIALVERPTGTAHISVLDGGENAIVVVPDANGVELPLDDVQRDAIRAARSLVVQFERPLPLVAEALAFARSVGVTTVVTPAPVLPLPDGFLDHVDVLVPNAGEARELAGVSDEADAARALSLRVGTVVMTRGARGALVARGGEIVAEVQPHPVTPVDTTGAGDTFTGVLVARLAAGDAEPDALRAASVAAAIATTRPGASPSMPTWPEVEPHLR